MPTIIKPVADALTKSQKTALMRVHKKVNTAVKPIVNITALEHAALRDAYRAAVAAGVPVPTEMQAVAKRLNLV